MKKFKNIIIGLFLIALAGTAGPVFAENTDTGDQQAAAEVWGKKVKEAHPDLDNDTIKSMWRLHNEYPKLTNNDLKWMAGLRQAHPNISKDKIKAIWEFHQKHPNVDQAAMQDMYRFNKNHPNMDNEEFAKAYKKYQEDPAAFRATMKETKSKKKAETPSDS